MALQTPHLKGRSGLRPSLLSTNLNPASSPNLLMPSSTAIARKASLNALTGQSPDSAMPPGAVEVEVGDIVDVPGAMYGTVKFVGPVRGKRGTFAGVELSKEFATRGKNDGDVEGVRYFTTSIPGSGIFLPIHRASRRPSVTASDGSFPPTPTTPFLSNNFGLGAQNPLPTQTPAAQKVSQFSKSVGPGARPSSPLSKMKTPRPSLPRPESPLRRPPTIPPPQSRGPSLGGPFSKSQIGAPRFSPSPAPRPLSPGKTKTPARPYSRSNSRAGMNKPDLPNEPVPQVPARSSDGSIPGSRSANSSGSGFAATGQRPSDDARSEIDRLTRALEDRDKQLKDQSSQLTEMESSLTELQTLLPTIGSPTRNDEIEGADTSQLRTIVREKNEKIASLTADFDSHRAEFRSTIDALEMATEETERIYKVRVEELSNELRELQDGRDDFENISKQFKQLEELVADLEEGLEDARRGEAEARGEVEFLRGEVERGRIELQRERELAQSNHRNIEAAAAGARDSRDIEQRDDEIRGLKAIIHSLSFGGDTSVDQSGNLNSTSDGDTRMQATLDRLEREKRDLQSLVERKAYREEELEREIEKLRINAGYPGLQRASVVSNGMSDRTVLQEPNGRRSSKGTVVNWRDSRGIKQDLPAMPEISDLSSHHHHHHPQQQQHDQQAINAPPAPPSSTHSTGSGVLWCEICEASGHDILTCASMDKHDEHDLSSSARQISNSNSRFRSPTISSQDPDRPKPLSLGSHNTTANTTNGTSNGVVSGTTQGINKKLPAIPPSSGAPPTAPLPNPHHLPSFATDSTMTTTSSSSPSLSHLVPGKDGSLPDPNKWCALCERDGHDSINCGEDEEY